VALRRGAPPVSTSWVLYAASWLPLVGLYTATFVASRAPFGQALFAAVASLLPSALLGAPLVGLVIPAPEGRGGRFALRHARRSVLFVVLATALWIALVAAERAATRTPFRLDGRVVAYQVTLTALFYAVLAGIAQARQESARLAVVEALRTKAELQALRSQLNPHFVLNALHTVHALVRRDPARAELAIEELGRLLAYGLRQQREELDEVTLAEEWAFVSDYLKIERLRFEDRLAVALDGDDAALACRILPFSIQPLVENAIVHAVAPRAAGGAVRVQARRLGDLLRVSVGDDGPGMPESGRNGHGLGLRLVQQRLAALYGDEARLSIASRDGAGTEVTLEIPQRDEAREGA
jgi:sensor histidine kinase YesM